MWQIIFFIAIGTITIASFVMSVKTLADMIAKR